MGSGKSYCCSLFASLGVPVFLTDISAKKLMAENDEVKRELRTLISADIYNEDGTVNRDVLQFKLFECDRQEKYRDIVNRTLYSYVEADYEKFCKDNEQAPYIMCESAILFETGWFDKFDYIIYVNAPEDVRIERVIKRSNLTEEQQRARMKNQLNPKLKMRASDFVIENHGRNNPVKQVDCIHEELVKRILEAA